MLFAELVVCVGFAAESAPLAQGLLQEQTKVVFAAESDSILIAVAEEKVLHGAPEDCQIELGLLAAINLVLKPEYATLTFSWSLKRNDSPVPTNSFSNRRALL